MQAATNIWISVFNRLFRRGTLARYQTQANVTAAWVVREVRKVISVRVSHDLAWELDEFQLFLARAIYRELINNNGYFPISNTPLMSPTALFYEALRSARIHPPEPVIQALPHVRIRIVPGWVKVYGVGLHESAPLVLYPVQYANQ
jgi:hypothetical protein